MRGAYAEAALDVMAESVAIARTIPVEAIGVRNDGAIQLYGVEPCHERYLVNMLGQPNRSRTDTHEHLVWQHRGIEVALVRRMENTA